MSSCYDNSTYGTIISSSLELKRDKIEYNLGLQTLNHIFSPLQEWIAFQLDQQLSDILGWIRSDA